MKFMRINISAAAFFLACSFSFAHADNVLMDLKDYASKTPPSSFEKIRKNNIVIYDVSTPKNSGLHLIFAVVGNKKTKIRTIPIKKFGPSYEVLNLHVARESLASINGGFFGYTQSGAYDPIGLVISNGEVKNKIAKWKTGGIVYQGNEGVGIAGVSNFNLSKDIREGLQSKPLLIQNGIDGIRRDDGERFNRTAFCLTQSGEIVLVGAFESFGRALSLKELSEFMIYFSKKINHPLVSALAMDGGPGAQLYFPLLNLHYGDPGKNYIPNAISIME